MNKVGLGKMISKAVSGGMIIMSRDKKSRYQ